MSPPHSEAAADVARLRPASRRSRPLVSSCLVSSCPISSWLVSDCLVGKSLIRKCLVHTFPVSELLVSGLLVSSLLMLQLGCGSSPTKHSAPATPLGHCALLTSSLLITRRLTRKQLTSRLITRHYTNKTYTDQAATHQRSTQPATLQPAGGAPAKAGAPSRESVRPRRKRSNRTGARARQRIRPHQTGPLKAAVEPVRPRDEPSKPATASTLLFNTTFCLSFIRLTSPSSPRLPLRRVSQPALHGPPGLNRARPRFPASLRSRATRSLPPAPSHSHSLRSPWTHPPRSSCQPPSPSRSLFSTFPRSPATARRTGTISPNLCSSSGPSRTPATSSARSPWSPSGETSGKPTGKSIINIFTCLARIGFGWRKALGRRVGTGRGDDCMGCAPTGSARAPRARPSGASSRARGLATQLGKVGVD